MTLDAQRLAESVVAGMVASDAFSRFSKLLVLGALEGRRR